MKLPFVSRKRYDTMTELMAERIDYLERERDYRDQKHADEVRVLQEALFHKKRADAYEEHVLKGLETMPAKIFVPKD